jgi:HemY protein
MRKLIILLIFFLLAIMAGLHLVNDPGYALFVFQHWSMEMPLWLCILLVLVFYILLATIRALLRNLGAYGKRFQRWKKKQRHTRANDSLQLGLIEFIEGNWRRAENYLSRHLKDADTPMLHLLFAAQAAHELKHYDKRDDYLRRAHGAQPRANIAIGLTQAKLQRDQGQLEQALATLRHLQQLSPRHPYVLKASYELYQILHDWQSLDELLVVLKKRHLISEEEFKQQSARAFAHQLTQAPAEAIDPLWKKTAKHNKTDPQNILLYARHLQANERVDQARTLLTQALNQGWDHALFNEYCQYSDAQDEGFIKQIDVWHQRHPACNDVLFIKGRIAANKQRFAQAKQYYEQCLQQNAKMEYYVAIANLYEQQGKTEQAYQWLKKGTLQHTPQALNTKDSSC